jgi:hypothetical protein
MTTKDEYREQVLMCWHLAMMAQTIDTTKILEGIANAESLGPLLDPTAWIRNNRAMEEDKKIVEAVARLRGAYIALKPEFEARQEKAANAQAK